MQFSQVVGQKKVKDYLTGILRSGRIPHAQMFFGPEGSGSMAMALAFAQYIICDQPGAIDSCGVCKGCLKAEKLIHPDIHYIYPVNTSDKVKKDAVSDDYINEWRELIAETPYFTVNSWYARIGLENKQGLISRFEGDQVIRKLSLKPFESNSKVMIFWLPEKMNRTSSNMLLKLIEEPPERSFFIFISENPQDILPTIASRIQPVRLDPIDDISLKEAVQNKYTLSDIELGDIVRLARGNLIKAFELIETSEEVEYNFERFTGFMRLCWGKKMIDLNVWVDEMHAIGRERLKSYFIYALRLLRENFIMNVQKDDLVYLNVSEKNFSEKFYPFINGKNITSIYREFNQAYLDIESNAYAKIVLMDLAIKMVKLIRK